MSEKQNENELATLLGGVEIEVEFLDGTKETVKVRQLPVKDLGRYLSVLDDEYKTAALFCDKPADWVDRLTNGSFEAVIDQGEELNLDFLSRYVDRRNKRLSGVMGGMQDKIIKEITSQYVSGRQDSPSKPDSPSSK